MEDFIIIILLFICLLIPPAANHLDKDDFEQKYEYRRSYKEIFGENYEIDSDYEK